MTDIVAIAGSPTLQSRSTLLLESLVGQIGQKKLDARLIRVRELSLPALFEARADDAEIAQALEDLAGARGVIVATPVYKAAYAGTLKLFLDLLPQDALAGKTVLSIATGGSPAHLLAIDYALKPVLFALGATHVLGGIYLTDGQIQRRADGGVDLVPEIAERIDRGLAELLRGLPAKSNQTQLYRRTA